MITIDRKETNVHRIKDMELSETSKSHQNMLISTRLNDRLLDHQEMKYDFLTRLDQSLEKQHSTTEKLRRELYKLKQSSFKTDDKAPSTSHVMEILLHSFQCVNKEDANSSSCSETDIVSCGDDDSLLEDFEDDLKDSIHLAKRRFGPRDSVASSPASKRRGDDESLNDDFEDDLKDSVHLAKRRFHPRNSETTWPATQLRGDMECELEKRQFRKADSESSCATTKLRGELKSLRDSVGSTTIATIVEPGSHRTVRAKAAWMVTSKDTKRDSIVLYRSIELNALITTTQYWCITRNTFYRWCYRTYCGVVYSRWNRLSVFILKTQCNEQH